MIKTITSIFSLYFVLALHAPEYSQYAFKYIKDPYRELSIEEKIVYRAIDIGFPSQLGLDIARDESGFNPFIVSKDGHNWGVFQLNDYTINRFLIRNPLDADENINFSINELMVYWIRFKHDEKKVVCAWRRGPNKCY